MTIHSTDFLTIKIISLSVRKDDRVNEINKKMSYCGKVGTSKSPLSLNLKVGKVDETRVATRQTVLDEFAKCRIGNQ